MERKDCANNLGVREDLLRITQWIFIGGIPYNTLTISLLLHGHAVPKWAVLIKDFRANLNSLRFSASLDLHGMLLPMLAGIWRAAATVDDLEQKASAQVQTLSVHERP